MFHLACLRVLGLAALAWMGSANAQDIYKWVDSEGVTRYTASPPPAGVAATLIQAAPPPSAEAASKAKADARRKIHEANRRAAERSREQAKQQAQDEGELQSAAARLQLCATSREQLGTLERGRSVYRYNERGERVYLEDSARDAEIARLRTEVATYCSAGDTAQGAQDAATHRRTAEAARSAQCNAARDAARSLAADSARIPEREIEQAREEVRRLCASNP